MQRQIVIAGDGDKHTGSSKSSGLVLLEIDSNVGNA